MEKSEFFERQLIINQVKNPVVVCAFTGHRVLEEKFSQRKLKKVIKTAIEEGVEEFLCGMARGFDMLSAECVLYLKRKYKNVKLTACLPCENQEKNYSEEDKKRYVKILKKADKKILLATTYYKGCMLVRDKYMADNADMMIAYLKKETGGTAYTVRYFTKKYPLKEIVFL